MSEIALLGRRAVREVWRMPEATIPTLFIPLFFLAVNIGQVSRTFPKTTPFLHGQGYVGFQLPVSLMFAVCTATSGLALVTEIDLGYFDRGIGTSVLVLAVGLAFGANIRSGILGAVVLVLLSARWGVAYAGIGLLVALHTRNVQATSASFLVFFPLLFLTPNFVPFNLLTPLMNTLAHVNPVSYVIEGLRSLVLEGWVPDKLVAASAVIVATGLLLTALSVRAIENYDR